MELIKQRNMYSYVQCKSHSCSVQAVVYPAWQASIKAFN